MVNGISIKPAYKLHSPKELYKPENDMGVYARAEMLKQKNAELNRKLTA